MNSPASEPGFVSKSGNGKMLDKYTVTLVPDGARVSFEALVPLPAALRQSDETEVARRLEAIRQIEAAIPALIPSLCLPRSPK